MKRITLMAGVRVGLALITLGSLAGCCTPNRCAPFALSVSGEEMSIDLGNGVDMTFVRIPAGSFIMGSSTTNRLDEKPLHRVTFAKPFYMSKYLVTVAQWEQIIGDGRSYSKGTNDPVNNVSWYDGQDLIGVLNHNLPRLKFSLPTEAQYEYACRASGAGEYCYGDDVSKLVDYGWYKVNSGRRLHPVGQKKPNAWGLYV